VDADRSPTRKSARVIFRGAKKADALLAFQKRGGEKTNAIPSPYQSVEGKKVSIHRLVFFLEEKTGREAQAFRPTRTLGDLGGGGIYQLENDQKKGTRPKPAGPGKNHRKVARTYFQIKKKKGISGSNSDHGSPLKKKQKKEKEETVFSARLGGGGRRGGGRPCPPAREKKGKLRSKKKEKERAAFSLQGDGRKNTSRPRVQLAPVSGKGKK